MTRPRDSQSAIAAPTATRAARRVVERRHWRARRDWGGTVARALCGLFAIVGLIPLLLGVLVRLASVQAWAAKETSRLLVDELQIRASYRLRIQPWPFQIALEDLRVDANDGGEPVLSAQRVVIHPRMFALLDGELDVGDVRIDEPKVRVVVKDGKLVNLSYQLPKRDAARRSADRLPLAALSISNGELDLTVDGVRLRARQLDMDVTADDEAGVHKGGFPPSPLELSLRAGAMALDRVHADPIGGERIDEDAICSLGMRARLTAGELYVRRLDVVGAVDFDPGAGSRPTCALVEEDWRQASLHVAALRVTTRDGAIDSAEGRAKLRLPVPIVHRFVSIAPTTGSVDIDAETIAFERGQRLPRVHGRVIAKSLGLDSKIIANRFEAAVEMSGERIKASDIVAHWGGGIANIQQAVVRPLAEHVPLEALGVVVRGIQFPELFDSVSGSPNAHVAWTLDKVTVDRFAGTITPLDLSGPMLAETRDFVVYDRPTWQDGKKRIMGISSANVSGLFQVTDPRIVLERFRIALPNSLMNATVSLHFDEDLGITVFAGSYVELRDISPLADVELAGKATLELKADGRFTRPHVFGNVDIQKLDIEGFPIGSLSGKANFEPLALDLREATLVHGKSAMSVPRLKLDFGAPPTSLVLTGSLDTNASGLEVEDLLRMIKLEQDPRFRGMAALAKGNAEARYVLGGPEDRCGGGRLWLTTAMRLSEVQLGGQLFESGSVALDYLWDDMPAGDHGLFVDLHSATLRKGGGAIVGRASIRHNAAVEADLTATAIPLSAIDGLGLAGVGGAIVPEATVSAMARLSGTLQRMRGDFDVALSTVRIGPATLPASRVAVRMLPEDTAVEYEGSSECGNRIAKRSAPSTAAGPMTPAKAASNDESAAVWQLDRGRLFGGQIVVEDIVVARGARPMLKEGTIKLDRLDLGALANLIPGVAYSTSAPKGQITADLRLQQVPLDAPALGNARVSIEELEIERDGAKLRIDKVAKAIELANETLALPPLPLTITPRAGLTAKIVVDGRVEELSTDPAFAITASLEPIDLAKLTDKLPFVSRAAGMVNADLRLGGTYALPRLTGELRLEDGMARFASFALPLDDIAMTIGVRDNEIEIKEATARAGNSGYISLTGRMPLRGLDIAEASLSLAARDVALPLATGVNATANAALKLSYQPDLETGVLFNETSAALPQITGTVSLTRFTYARPMAFRVDLDQLAGKRKTVVETYNPRDDLFHFDVNIVSPRPLRIANDLIDASLEVMQPGLRLVGTNQRFGARGNLHIDPASKLFIQGHDFRVREGRVEFDNLQRVTPRLDILAETEHRRYESRADLPATASGDAASASSAGVWRIRMRATGDTDSPLVQFSSEPQLSQDDIVLLLTIGMTRAELDRGLATSLAQSVSLEALSAVTGFDQALKKTVPLIDEFRLGNQYSSRTGRPEPTVSVGKRITEDVRATVTTGLSDNREVRSNIEWKLSRGISVQGSYDNVNDVSSSALGNIGADLRWRIEFE